MKTMNRSNLTSQQKPKKSKKLAKAHSLDSIAARYLELRRLRERISQAESRLHVR